MTAALQSDYPPRGGWTTDDLDALPEDGRRRELLDGVLIVSPSPTRLHQTIACASVPRSKRAAPTTYDVTQAVEVRINRTRSFIPDVLVTEPDRGLAQPVALRAARGHAGRRDRLPEDPRASTGCSSRRSTPQAGIPYYWRIETEDADLVVHTYKIDAVNEVYVETGPVDEVRRHRRAVPDRTCPIARITPRPR